MKNREAGFTLLETLVAFTIFSVVLVTIYESLSTSVRGEAEARSVLSSAQIAKSVMAEVGLSIPLVEGTLSERESEGFEWSLQIQRVGPPASSRNNAHLMQLYRLNLSVQNSSGGTFVFRRTMLGRIDG